MKNRTHRFLRASLLNLLLLGTFLFAVFSITLGRKYFLDFEFYEDEDSDYVHPSCFDTIDHTTKYSSACYDRMVNYKYFACQFGFSPFEADLPRVSIICSRHPIGIALRGLLKHMKYNYSEIKSYYHMQLNHVEYADVLNYFNFICHIVIDPLPDEVDLLYKLNAPVIVLCGDNETIIEKTKNIYVYRIPGFYGPDYASTISNGRPTIYMQWCSIASNNFAFPEGQNMTKRIAFSGDIASMTVKIMEAIINGFDPPEFVVKTISPEELMTATKMLLPKCQLPDVYERPSLSTLAKVKLTIDFYKKKHSKPPKDIYLSWVTTVCDINRIISRANEQINYFSWFLEVVPNMPVEFIYVYAKKDNSSKDFFQTFKVPDIMKSYLKVIEIPPEEVASMSDDDYTFPEFQLKNIGIRSARGEYIISGNSDIIPPHSLFDHAIRRLFSPGIYRSVRYLGNEQIPRDYYELQKFYPYYDSEIIDYSAYEEYSAYMNKLRTRSSGDFQGCHRKQWEQMHGFLETGDVLHVDSWMLLEFAAYKFPTFLRVIGLHVHLDHVKVSQELRSVKVDDFFTKGFACQGHFSNDDPEYARPNWGLRRDPATINKSRSYKPKIVEDEMSVDWTFDQRHIDLAKKENETNRTNIYETETDESEKEISENIIIYENESLFTINNETKYNITNTTKQDTENYTNYTIIKTHSSLIHINVNHTRKHKNKYLSAEENEKSEKILKFKPNNSTKQLNNTEIK